MSTLQIQEFGGEIISLDLTQPLVTSRSTYKTRDILLITCEILISEGNKRTRIRGYGEAAPLPGWTSEDIDDCLHRLARLPRDTQLANIDKLDDYYPKLANTPSLRFGVELAILDGLSRFYQITLRRFLTGSNTAPVLDSLPVQLTLGSSDIAATCRAAVDAIKSGVQAVKIKVGARSQQDDIQCIEALRMACPDVKLRLDANGAWTFDEARDFLQNIEPFQIDLVEQPVPRGEEEALLTLARITPIDIAADESCAPPSQARNLIDGGIDALVIKPTALGGLLPTKQLIHYAADKGTTIILSTLLESAVARRAVAQLAASTPTLAGPHGLNTGHWFAEDLAPQPDGIENGYMILDEGPGIGFIPTEKAATIRRAI